MFAAEADASGVLSRPAFNRAFSKFVGRMSHEDTEKHRLVLSHLFDVFDANADGVVDSRELVSGLSFLCGGSNDDRVKSAFALYGMQRCCCCYRCCCARWRTQGVDCCHGHCRCQWRWFH